jgi:beta-xylosidase
VLRWKKPDVGMSSPVCALPTSDEFDGPDLGLAWQWHANHRAEWSSLTSRSGFLRLFAVAEPESCKSLWDVPNLLLQKFPAPAFEVTVCLNAGAISPGERAGLVVMGRDYSLVGVTNDGRGMRLTRSSCVNADKGSVEKEEENLPLRPGDLLFRLEVDSAAVCTFSYCQEGGEFRTLGERFTAREGVWIGAKVGLFHTARTGAFPPGHTDVDYVRFAHYAGQGG